MAAKGISRITCGHGQREHAPRSANAGSGRTLIGSSWKAARHRRQVAGVEAGRPRRAHGAQGLRRRAKAPRLRGRGRWSEGQRREQEEGIGRAGQRSDLWVNLYLLFDVVGRDPNEASSSFRQRGG